MPDLIPLKGYYYREGKDENKLKKLVAPPYDVISEEEKIEMIKNPDNICHVILPESYEAAGLKLEEMINNKILITGNNRCLYIYGIDYEKPDTREKISRYGFVGLLKLVEIFPANDGVIPHEMTFKKFTEDRLRIIQETNTNFSPIFTIYNGKNGTAQKLFKKYIDNKPFLQTIDRDGFTHKIWEVEEKEDMNKLKEIVQNHKIIIADGHHRFITCLRHSRHGGCKYIMALFIDFNDPGLIIYTSHREVHKLNINNINELKSRLKDNFIIKDVANFETLQTLMAENKNIHVLGCYFQKSFIFLRLKMSIRPEDVVNGIHSDVWKSLNIPILHKILLKDCLDVDSDNITFIKDIQKGIQKVDDGKISAIFIINPTTLSEIHAITRLGEIMPQKSTYFYPKPLSGLIIHQHTDKSE